MREGRIRVRRNGSGRERDRGASLVEFALVVPLLTLFLFGIVQFGIAYDMKQSINSAAREGARTAAIPARTFAQVDTAAKSAFQGVSDDGEVTVKVSNATTAYSAERVGADPPTGTHADNPCADRGGIEAEGTTVVVTVDVTHTLTIPFFGAPELELTGRGEFRCEREV